MAPRAAQHVEDDGLRTERVSAALTPRDRERVEAYAAALGERSKMPVGVSMAAAALIREGLAAVERAGVAS